MDVTKILSSLLSIIKNKVNIRPLTRTESAALTQYQPLTKAGCPRVALRDHDNIPYGLAVGLVFFCLS
jgi:hypothetical protein